MSNKLSATAGLLIARAHPVPLRILKVLPVSFAFIVARHATPSGGERANGRRGGEKKESPEATAKEPGNTGLGCASFVFSTAHDALSAAYRNPVLPMLLNSRCLRRATSSGSCSACFTQTCRGTAPARTRLSQSAFPARAY